jgi:hypothetical protein
MDSEVNDDPPVLRAMQRLKFHRSRCLGVSEVWLNSNTRLSRGCALLAEQAHLEHGPFFTVGAHQHVSRFHIV